MEHGRGVRREPQSWSIPTPRSNQSIGTLNPMYRAGGPYSHNGVMDYPRCRECMLENSWTHWNFKAEKSTSRLKYVQIQRFLTSQCIGSKKLK